ncbi:SusD/RagB family nutrient-binding outer membrane lipoprotein, partial [archaeon]
MLMLFLKTCYFAKAATPYNITDTLTSRSNTLHYIVSYPIPHLGQPKSAANLPSWDFTSATNPTGFAPFSGANGQQGNFSRPQPSLFAADRPFYIMSYAELCFMKAEASNKGYGGSQSAEAYYNAGVAANFAFWGLSAAQTANYL